MLLHEIRDVTLKTLWLALCLFVIPAQAQTLTGITISGPSTVPSGSFSPGLAVYTATGTYSNGTTATMNNVTWTRVLNNDTRETQSQIGNYFGINLGAFSTLKLTASYGTVVSPSITVMTSSSAEVPHMTAPTMTAPTSYSTPMMPTNTSVHDSYYISQSSLFTPAVSSGGINVDGAWAITTGDPNLVIGIVDMGVLNHADLEGRLLTGYNFVEGINDGLDPGGTPPNSGCFTAWHGTGVAGVIGANSNRVGVAGINWNSKMLPVRAVQSFMGSCNGSDIQVPDIIAKGIRWASGLSVSGAPTNSTPAKVINVSLQGQVACTYSSIRAAVADATANGTTVVISAGNQGVDSSNYSLCPDAIWVAAIDSDGGKAAFTNTGTGITIAAPGSGGIYTTSDSGTTTANNDNTYKSFGGTSASAPFITGVISLMLSANPSLTPMQIKQMLTASARVFPTSNVVESCTTTMCGAGIVDAVAAVTLASNALSDCVFNWAERTYPQFFSPANAVSATVSTYYYRYYSGTGSYLATSSPDMHLWVLGPDFGNNLVDVGLRASVLTMAGC